LESDVKTLVNSMAAAAVEAFDGANGGGSYAAEA
jgi:hypothetical protein